MLSSSDQNHPHQKNRHALEETDQGQQTDPKNEKEDRGQMTGQDQGHGEEKIDVQGQETVILILDPIHGTVSAEISQRTEGKYSADTSGRFAAVPLNAARKERISEKFSFGGGDVAGVGAEGEDIITTITSPGITGPAQGQAPPHPPPQGHDLAQSQGHDHGIERQVRPVKLDFPVKSRTTSRTMFLRKKK